MTDALWLILATLSALLGLSWLALSLKSHWRQVYPDNETGSQKKRLRVVGSLFLLASALCCFQADHPSMAVLVWIMLVPAAAITVGMTLSQRPTLLRVICPGFFSVKNTP